MAPPRKNPPKDAATTIHELATAGHSIIGIAHKFGVSKDTFKRWLEEDDKLQDAFDLGRETERQSLHALVIEGAKNGKGPNVNAFFILKARHGYREGDQQNVKIDVAVQSVLVVKDHGTDEEWELKAVEQQRKLAAG